MTEQQQATVIMDLQKLAGDIRSVMAGPEVERLADRHLAESVRRELYTDWGSSPEWSYQPCPEKVRDFNRLIVAARRVLPPGSSIETGVFRGGTSGPLILTAPPNSFHVAIDPYGLPEQSYKDAEGNIDAGYADWPHARSTLRQLAALAHECDVTFSHYLMSAQTFIDADLLRHPGRFSIVHLDGDHEVDAVIAELRYFRGKLGGPALFILDDHDNYNPGVQAGLNQAGAGLVRIFHNFYQAADRRMPFGFSAWLHVTP